ncbi:3'-5' exonuclease [Elasticomyces elasticus]|nr:3'-5' exonuclease [Elasticomyces elasticus]KAK3644477.1 3'-5' exonuclease [Elasticomyces elasticus]KAK4915514.1 3'-5' exonuclease [Elasticomyces elasticus]KAK5756231.1 3'-5' exonuclease [Elasticomyces elasticus]
MPVTTISADRISYKNGYREIKPEVKPVLGYGDVGPDGWRCRGRQLHPRMDLVVSGLPVACDCEGVILDDETGKEKMGLGRISFTTIKGELIFDTFDYYSEDVAHRPNPQWLELGVKYKDILAENGARPHNEIIKDVQAIVDKSGFVIGHAFGNDMNMLRGVCFDKVKIRDTQAFSGFRQYAKDVDPSLADLCMALFNRAIQKSGHSSIVDARTTMKIYLRYRDEIDREQMRFDPGVTIIINKDDTAYSSSTDSSITTRSSSMATHHTSSNTTAGTTPSPQLRCADCKTMKKSILRAPGHLVALPAIPEMARGRHFDYSTSTYL